MSITEHILKREGLLVGLVFLPVFVCSFDLLDYGLIPRFLLLSAFSGLFLAYLFLQVVRGDLRLEFKLTPIKACLALWFIASAVSGIRSDLIGEYLFEIHRIFLYLMVFLIAGVLVNSNSDFRPIARFSAIINLTICCIGLWQFHEYNVGLVPKELKQVTGLMSNNNLFSEYLVMLIPFNMYGLFLFRGNWQRLSLLSVMVGIVLVTLLMGRAAWVGLFLSTMFALGLYLFRYGFVGLRKHRLKIVIVLAVVVGFFVALNWHFENHLVDRLTSVFETNTGTAGLRLKIWKLSWVMIKEAPLVGHGLGDWKIAFQDFNLTKVPNKFVVEPLNDFVGVFSETGLFGIMGYVGALTIGLARLVVLYFRKLDSYFHLFSSMVLAAFLTISFFNFPLHRIEHMTLAMFVLAVADKDASGIRIRVNGLFRYLLLGFLTVPVISSFVVGVERYEGEKFTKQALEARNEQDWSKVVEAVSLVNTTIYPIEPSSTPVIWYRGIAHFQLQNIDAALQDFEAAYLVNPYHIHVLNNLGTCYILTGDYEKGIDLYENVIYRNNNFYDTHKNLLAMYLRMNRFEDAIRVIDSSSSKLQRRFKKKRKRIVLRWQKYNESEHDENKDD